MTQPEWALSERGVKKPSIQRCKLTKKILTGKLKEKRESFQKGKVFDFQKDERKMTLE